MSRLDLDLLLEVIVREFSPVLEPNIRARFARLVETEGIEHATDVARGLLVSVRDVWLEKALADAGLAGQEGRQ